MNLSGISSFYHSQPLTQSKAATQVDPVQKAFTKATERLQKERDVTSAQISAYGQVKSGFARVEDNGKALAATQPSTAPEGIKKNLQAFVNAYNDTRNAAGRTETGKAQLASRDLQRTVSSDPLRTDMKSLGITRNQDGSLKLDTKALDTALQANPDTVRGAASRLGSAVQKTASSALSGNGSVGASLNALNARDQDIAARQSAQQKMFDASQQNVAQASTRISNAIAGIGSYNRIFSM